MVNQSEVALYNITSPVLFAPISIPDTISSLCPSKFFQWTVKYRSGLRLEEQSERERFRPGSLHKRQREQGSSANQHNTLPSSCLFLIITSPFHVGVGSRPNQGGSRMVSEGSSICRTSFTYSNKKAWANNEDPQTLQDAASHQDLHGLSLTQQWRYCCKARILPN